LFSGVISLPQFKSGESFSFVLPIFQHLNAGLGYGFLKFFISIY
jgi:hypothetical protein